MHGEDTMRGIRSLSSSGEAADMRFPDDFDRLQSSWAYLNINFSASPTTSLIRHIIDCVGVLRDLNQDRARRGVGEGVLTSAICNSSFNTLSTSLERILLDSMTCQLPPESPAEASNVLDLGCSILRQFPDAAKLEKTGSSQKTLLHRVAIKPSCGVQSIKSVFSYCRKSIEMTDAMGALPLHHATHASPPDVNIVRTLIDLYPAAASVADKAGYLPLHWAVNSTNAKVEIVRMLLKAYPEGAMKPCKGGSLPLHWSVDRDKPLLGIVEELTNTYRAGLSKSCALGWLPIHRCVDRADPKLSVLKWLINHYPNGLRVANSDGQLPLHRLVDRSSPTLSSIQLVATSYPEALLVPDAEGYLPLHLALDGDNPSPRVVCSLIQMCPESASVTTIDGLLPLHCALNCCLSAVVPREIILALLNAYPAGAMQEAVDMVPADSDANPDDWDGPWRQVKWTPLTRAEELEDDDLINDIKMAILNSESVNYGDHVNVGIRRSSSDSLNQLGDCTFVTVGTNITSMEVNRSGPGASGHLRDSYSAEDNISMPFPMPDFSSLNNPMPSEISSSCGSLNSSLKTNGHSKSASNVLVGISPPETSAPGSPFDKVRGSLGSGGWTELGISSHSMVDIALPISRDCKLPVLNTRVPPSNKSMNPNPAFFGGKFSSAQVAVEPPTPDKQLAIDIMSPLPSRDDASVYSIMSRGSVDSSQFSTGSSRRASGMWVKGDDSVSSSTDGGTFFRRKNRRNGHQSDSKYGPGDSVLHDFGAILEDDEKESPRATVVGTPVYRANQSSSPVISDKKYRSRRAKKQQQEQAEKITDIISKGRQVAAPSTSTLLNIV